LARKLFLRKLSKQQWASMAAVTTWHGAPEHVEWRKRMSLHTSITRARAFAIGLAAAVAWLVAASVPFAQAQQPTLTKEQRQALAAYDKALEHFKGILATRRAQITMGQKLPSNPGQAVYLARINVMSTYKDLTDVMPERIGRPNKYGIPPAYFDADIEPLIEEYSSLFGSLEKAPKFAQASKTPFKDVVDLGTAIGRAQGLDPEAARAAGRISLGIFFAETNGKQNIGNTRSKKYKGSLQTGVSENRRGRRKWHAIKPKVAKLAPEVIARDAKEEARVKHIDERYNHWIAVRNGLMNAHADLFAQLPKIMRILPDEIDQMKLFQLIQLIPAPTRSALASRDFLSYRVDSPRIMGYLRNNSIFTFGKKDRAKTSATFREILDAMWLYNRFFMKARSKYQEIMKKRSAPAQ
jgi:hypothetical protein